MSFSHDIAGGNGELVVPQVVSPNFVHGSTGWRLGKDGSLEAHDIILPDGQGVSVFFAGTAPTTTHVGDLWYNTSNGLELSRWDGSSWIPFQISSGAIATGGISAGNIASLTASLIGNLGVLNPNPYFWGGDDTGWIAQNGTFSVTSSPPTGAPFEYAGLLTANATTPNVLINNGAFQAVPGQQYLITAWVYSSFATISVGFNWQLGGSYVSTGASTLTVTPDTWTPVSVVKTAPASGINRGLPLFATSGGNGATLYVQAATAFPQVPGSLIQAGTVTAAQIAAGVVVAGIIDGTTVSAAQYIADGTSGEFLAYTSTPANGNLLLSISPAAGTDSHSNAYKDGLAIYKGTAWAQMHVNPDNGLPALELYTGLASEGNKPSVYVLPSNSGGVNEQEALVIQGPESTRDSDAVTIHLYNTAKDGSTETAGFLSYNTTPQAYWDNQGFHVSNVLYGASGTLTIGDNISMTGKTISADTWHTVTLQTGWSSLSGYAVLQYRLLPDGNIQISGAAQFSSSFTSNTKIAALPTGYQPSSKHVVSLHDALGSVARVEFNSDGTLWAIANATYPAQFVEIDCVCSLL